MDTFEHPESFIIDKGAFPSQGDFPGIPGTYIDGANLWFRGPLRLETDRGYSSSGAPSLGAAASPIMVSAGVPSGVTGGGTVTRHAGVQWAAGSGTACEGSLVLGAVSGQLMVYVGGSLVAAGITAPGAAVISDSGVASVKNSGSYSVALVAYRSTTGALSNRSLPSNVITVKGKKIRITFPAPVTGQTHWLLYGSRRAFGSVGPWFRLSSLSITALPVSTFGAGSTFDAEWFDGELGEIAPIEYDPPPSGITHCVSMGGSMVGITADGQVCPSIVGKPEAFPPGFRTNLASREAPTGVTARGTDGVAFVATVNSLSALLVTGDNLTPVIPRGIWENTGFAHGNSFTLVGRDIYGMAGSGPVRTHGEADPDQSFAAPVLEYMLDNGWTSANTRVAYAPDNHAVYFASGTKCWAYMLAGEGQGAWSGPFDVPSSGASVTVGGVGYLANGTTLVALDKSGGTAAAAFFITPYMGGPGGFEDHYKTLIRFKGRATANCTMDILNYATGASVGGSFFPHSFTAPHGTGWVKCNRKGIRGYALKVTFTAGGGKRFRGATLKMLVEPAHV